MIDCADPLAEILDTLEEAGFGVVANYSKACRIPKEPEYSALLIPEGATFMRSERRHPPIKKNLPLPKPKEKPFNHIDLIKHRRSFCNARNNSAVGRILRS